jgi:hypothetical protein
MKTAVSIVNRILGAAQRLAARWDISGSTLHAKPLNALAGKYHDEVVIARLNEVYGPDRDRSSLDPALTAMQHHTLKRHRD